MADADKEYSYTFPAGTKAFILQTRDGSSFKYAYVQGDIALDKYVTAHQGISKMEDDTGKEDAIIIYFSSSESGITMEVDYWL